MSESSISRVTHIPVVEAGIATVHSTLSSTPIIRTPYAISLSVSNKLAPLVYSLCAHYPLYPFVNIGDKAANKTLDIAEGTWPYPFRTDTEQIWKDVASAAKGVDRRFAPIVDTVSSVVHKISGNNVEPGKTDEDMYQFQRAYALLQSIKNDLVRSNDEQATVIRHIHTVLTRATEQSSLIVEAILSRSEDAAFKTQELGRSVLTELEKLPPLLASLSSHTSTNLRDTINSLRSTLYADEPWTQKLPKVRSTLQHGIKDIIEDVFGKIHEVMDDFRSTDSSSLPHGSSNEKQAGNAKDGKKFRSKNTRIVTNVNTGGTAVNMSEDTNLASSKAYSSLKQYSATGPNGIRDPRAKETIIQKERYEGRMPFENENIAAPGAPIRRR